ncbi:hypothetical protein GGF46_002269 [Coemansia sp. RSA 552]|nr:hypothetical protein GGF46_002269 [Coemansia sp. RSA 552]
MYHAQNATLGFQKIFVLNRPARTDRRRNMVALSRHHKLHFSYAPTFDKNEADSLAQANGYRINGTHLACYLSHLDIYRRIVRENIETALVLEDDVDMEMDMRERHQKIMDQIRRDYGDDWDMLYLGHCTSDANEPLAVHSSNRSKVADIDAGQLQSVTLYQTSYPMCMHAYAVTRESARRLAVVLEERLSTVGEDIDLVIAVGVEYGMATVLGTSPPYIVQIGRHESPSDLTQLRDGDTAQRLDRSTLFHLKLRATDPRTLPRYMDLP